MLLNRLKRFFLLDKTANNLNIVLDKINNSNFEHMYLISAAGYGNIGDDLVIPFIKNNFKSKKIYYLADVLNKNNEVINNIKKIGIDVELNQRRIDKNNSLILVGGGTLFNTSVFVNEDYLEYAYDLIKDGFKIVFFNIEAIQFNQKEKAKYVFSNSFFNAVRNVETRDIIHDLYSKEEERPEILLIGDLAEHINLKNEHRKEDIVGVCIPAKTAVNTETLKCLIDILLKKKYGVEFFSFCNHILNDSENDSFFANKFKREYFADNNLVSVFSETDTDKIFEHIQNYKIIITSRLHPTIVGKQIGAKVFNLSKEEKCIRYCRSNNIFNGTVHVLEKKFKGLFSILRL